MKNCYFLWQDLVEVFLFQPEFCKYFCNQVVFLSQQCNGYDPTLPQHERSSAFFMTMFLSLAKDRRDFRSSLLKLEAPYNFR